MTWRINLQPSNHHFHAEAKSTILEAGLREGLNLNHGCANGSCGDCRARLITGKLVQSGHHDFVLSASEKAQNYFLMCRHQAASDLVIEASEPNHPGEIPEQHITAKIGKMEPLQKDVMQLTVRTPRSKGLHFLAGQSVTLHFDGMRPKHLPIANCPCDNTLLRFHVRRHDGDAFSDLVFDRLKKGRELVLSGPFGDFTLDEASERPLLMLAWETGFAPIASLIDHAIDKDPEREIHLYWLSQIPEGHYLLNYCDAWQDALDHFQYQAIKLTPGEAEDLPRILMPIIKQHQPLISKDMYLALPAAAQYTVCKLLCDAGMPTAQTHLALTGC